MPRFAANIAFMYAELPFLERFAAASRDGFAAVEFFFPYPYAPQELALRLRDNGLQLVLFNATPRSQPTDRGVACLPGRQAEFRDSFLRALDYALALGCPNLHAMSGIVPAGVSRGTLRDVYLENLQWAGAQAAACGRNVLIEPINTGDIPGFFLNQQDEAHALVLEAGADNIKVQMDLYHCQTVEGDVAAKLRQYLPTGRVGHLQVAGVPDRHEPDGGELDYPALFELVDTLGFDGWTGAEYIPRLGQAAGATTAGLGWLRAARNGSPGLAHRFEHGSAAARPSREASPP